MDEIFTEQKEIDRLATILTEATMLLRAGNLKGAKRKLFQADRMCGLRIRPNPEADAPIYNYPLENRSYEKKKTATEAHLQQERAKLRMNQLTKIYGANLEDIAANLLNNLLETPNGST